MKIIAPSILDWINEANLADKINQLVDAGAKWIHYDIMDGIFVKNKTKWNNMMQTLKTQTKKHYRDFHLMVDDAERFLPKYENIADSCTFHFETVSYRKAHRIIRDFQNMRFCKIGIAINPKTNIEQIYEFLEAADMVLVMSVEPGKGGQSFLDHSLNKIARIKKYIDERNLNTLIEVDGGVKKSNIAQIWKAGADVAVAGSYITSSQDFTASIRDLIK